MDRFEWLKCQSWLLPACPSSATDVDWFFDGFASFYTCPLPHLHDEALSENAAHLFFSVQPNSALDPAQLTLKLGMTPQDSQCTNRAIVFAFESAGSFFVVDFKQVLSINNWRQEHGCKTCKESSRVSVADERENSCACRILPSYLTVRLKHVSMIIYSTKESSFRILGVLDVLCKAFEEERPSDCHGTEKVESTLCVSELPGSLNSVLGSSKRILQQFLTKLECMSECAVGAVEVCNANVPCMTQMLHVLMQHAADHREFKIQSKSVQCQLQSCLKALEDEKETYFSTLWITTHQEAKAGAIVALQHTLEQKKKLEESILWLELIIAKSVF